MNKSIRTLTRNILCLTIFSALISFSAGQPNIDPVQGEKELEVMKSVISTSLSLAKKSLREEESSEGRLGRYRRFDSDFDADVIEGYYLHGQGVVFTIPYPCLSGRFSGNWENDINIRLDEILEEELVDNEFLEQEVELMLHEVELQRQELGLSNKPHPAPAPPKAPKAPGAPEAPEAPEYPEYPAPVSSSVDVKGAVEAAKDLEKQVSKIKVRLREVKEQTEEQKEKTAKEREAIKKELIDVVAVHGGSLTQVKDNEFINLILKDSCEFFSWDGSGDNRTVLSIKKSDLSAYRSGQITLDQLKSRFVEY